jgi:hypothetical protein
VDGSPKGGRIKASIHFDTQAVGETDMDPGRWILLVGHEFNKCPDWRVVGCLVLKTTPPIIESAWIDLVFSAEYGSGQATFDLLAYQVSPVC